VTAWLPGGQAITQLRGAPSWIAIIRPSEPSGRAVVVGGVLGPITRPEFVIDQITEAISVLRATRRTVVHLGMPITQPASSDPRDIRAVGR
jgi:hypothetical protein